MIKLFGNANQSVSEYVDGLDLELPDDLAALNPGQPVNEHVDGLDFELPDDLTALNPGLDEPQQSAPAVEVHEVNDDAVWELWHDSVAFQDSQFADGLADESPLQPSQLAPDVATPLASGHKKSK